MPKIPKPKRLLQPIIQRRTPNKTKPIDYTTKYTLPSFHNDKPKNKSKLLDKFTKHLMDKEGW